MNLDQKIKLSENPNTPSKILETLATDKNWNVRWGVAKNPKTSSKTLESLATDENSYVRRSVGKNPNSSELARRLVLMTNKHLST